MRMDEKGVSPVIGVILMVAITVILAAVIASFVFGMASTPAKRAPVASLQAIGGEGKIIIRHVGGDPLKCDELAVLEPEDTSLGSTDGCSDGWLNVGEKETISGVGSGTKEVMIIHTPTNTILLQAVVNVKAGGGAGGGGAGGGGAGGEP